MILSQLYLVLLSCFVILVVILFIIGKISFIILLILLILLFLITLTLEYILITSIFPVSIFEGYDEFEKKYSDKIVEILKPNGSKINGILINTNSIYKDNIILFSHGNGCSIDSVYNSYIVEQLSKFGSVFIYDYTGYGKNNSFPSEKECYNDLISVWNYLTVNKNIEPSKICVVGHSLGCAISSKLVSILYQEVENNIKDKYISNLNTKLPNSLILICPFTNLSEICAESFQPLYYLVEGFDNIKNLKIINNKIPVLISHIINDKVIPYQHGIKLKNVTMSDFTLINGTHSTPILNDEFENFIYQKINKTKEKYNIWNNINFK